MSKEKKKEMLHTFALLFFIAAVGAALTFVIPAGEYERETVNGITSVIPGSYHKTMQCPIGPWKLFVSVVQGWSSANQLIFLTLAVGAAIQVLEDTGVIHASLSWLIQKVNGQEEWVIIIFAVTFSIIGGTGAFSNAVVATVPIGVSLSKRLGYDGLVGFGITYASAFTGFAAGWSNVFTTVIAQQIAQLPYLSGFGVRVAEHFLFMSITLYFILRYCRKIKKDPSQSLSEEKPDNIAVGSEKELVVTRRHKLTGMVGIGCFAALIVGTMKFGFGTTEMTAIFLFMIVLSGLCGGLGVNQTAVSFVNGLKNTCYAAILIGMAKSVSMVLTNGNVIDTIVFYMAKPITSVSPVFGAQIMYIFNFFFNFVISSGSGQAMAVMPIMVPVADLAGITRQVCVEAYRFGDSLSNLLWPTAGAMMASIAISGTKYTNYLKWAIPLVLTHAICGFLLITLMQAVQWGPF